MTRLNLDNALYLLTALLIVLGLAQTVSAQTTKIEGTIKARRGEIMILTTSASPSVPVYLTDSTQVGQVQGLLQARRKEMSMAALIPGLQVKVEGNLNEQGQLIATSVSFKGNDLEDAQKIEAGMHETKEELQKQKEELKAQNEALQQQQAQLNEHQEKIAANKAAVDAATARFGQLDDYYIFDEVVVYFANGKTNVDQKYVPQLLALTEKAKTVEGYVIEVKGYASSVGSVALNQELSEDRADAVTNILTQQGYIPLTRMLAPGAMGEAHQVGEDKTEKGQAENRRVVIRLLQNKGIAGV